MTYNDTDEYSPSAVFSRVTKRLSARQGVNGVIICDREGFTLSSNLDADYAGRISAHVTEILSRTKDVTHVAKRESLLGELTAISAISIELNKKELYIVPDKAGFIIVILREL
ncbi:MAG: roadblock/LC7 domain-containing protein [Candidatus Hodarchaeales archaeon]|jgi:predicted regulator of Ras-like GTPase activity (Roadblock/LC7/MglB family)